MEMFVARNWNSFLIYWLRSLPQNEWFSGETGKYTCNLVRKLDWCSLGQIRDRSERLSDALVNVCCSECLCFPLLQQRYVVVALNRASFHKAAALRYDISRWEDKFSYLCAFIFEAIRCHKSPPMKLSMFSQIKTFWQGPLVHPWCCPPPPMYALRMANLFSITNLSRASSHKHFRTLL